MLLFDDDAMRALRLTAPSTIEVTDVPVPEIGPDDVLLRVTGAGLCHSDLHVVHMPGYPVMPLTLGHEIAGVVEAVGDSVPASVVGTPHLVHLCWSCGTCRSCVAGEDNVCESTGRFAQPPAPGLGPDGGMAEFVRVPARYLVPLGELDPVSSAPLTDAALTPMHAIKSARSRLSPDATAVVIGVGGLGHMAVQILRAVTACRIVAVDVSPDKLEAAAAHGADATITSSDSTVGELLAMTRGRGADAIFDFVGAEATVAVGVNAIAPNGALRLVGLAGGVAPVPAAPFLGEGWPWGASVSRAYGGTRQDLADCVALAAAGRISVDVERFPLEDGVRAFERLEAGDIAGRAVLVP